MILVGTLLPLTLLFLLANDINTRFPAVGDQRPPLFGEALSLVFLLFLVVAPAALGAAYWFALLRLRSGGALRTWLDVVGWSVAAVFGTLILVGSEGYLYFVATDPATARAFGHPLWTLTRLGHLPGLVPVMLGVALVYATLGLGFALLFARWRQVHRLTLAPHGWRDLLVTWGAVAGLSLVAGRFINDISASLSSQEPGGAGAIRGGIELLALLLGSPFLVAVVASVSTFRALRGAWRRAGQSAA